MKDRNYSRLDKLEEAARRRGKRIQENQLDLSALNTKERIRFRELFVRIHEIEEENGIEYREALKLISKEELKELYFLHQKAKGRDTSGIEGKG